MENLDKIAVNSEDDDTERCCGIIMPISAMDNYSEAHWMEVRRILSTSIKKAGFESKIVSEADDIGVIHKRIVQNLYDNPIVVCDISGRNPNVMFELGLRLAFDKPTIIVKDSDTPYSFDTSVIEHLTYPKDLRYEQINNFINKLTEKILQTMEKYQVDPSTYSTFLKNFGSFKVPKLDEEKVSVDAYILDEIRLLRKDMTTLNRSMRFNSDFDTPKHRLERFQSPKIEIERTDYMDKRDFTKISISFSDSVSRSTRESKIKTLSMDKNISRVIRLNSNLYQIQFNEKPSEHLVQSIFDKHGLAYEHTKDRSSDYTLSETLY